MTQHSSSGPNLTIRTSIIKIYYQTIFHLEKGSVKAVIFSISHYILREKMDKQPSLEALLLSPGVCALLVCGPRGVGVGQRETTHGETSERWRPLVTPRQVCSAQHRYSDVFWEIRLGNLVILRFWEEGLENYSSTLQGFIHKHVPQGCDEMVFWENKGEPPNTGSLRKGKHFKAPGLGSTSKPSPEKGTCLMHLRVVGDCGDTLGGGPPAGGGESPVVSTVGLPAGDVRGVAWGHCGPLPPPASSLCPHLGGNFPRQRAVPSQGPGLPLPCPPASF